MQSPESLLITLLGMVLTVTADNKNYFTSPTSNNGINPVYTIGDDLLVSWVTELGVFNVTFWQQSLVQQSAASQGNIYAKIHASDQVTNFTWAVQLYDFDLAYSNVFFLWINPDGPDGFVSTYFNITEPKSTATTTSAIASTATSAQGINLASPRTSSSASSSTTSASPPSPSSSPALTTTSKIALGIGVGVGIPILCALGALIWLKARQKGDNATMQQIARPPGGLQPAWPMMQQPQASRSLHSEDSRPAELHGWRQSKAQCELPGSLHK